MFKLKIETENAAFENKVSEVSRILSTIWLRLANGETSGKLRDLNGNVVGEFELK